jgi:anti-sigma B factor antagonist
VSTEAPPGIPAIPPARLPDDSAQWSADPSAAPYPDPLGARLTVGTATFGPWSVITATGEVDLSSASQLREAVTGYLAADRVDLVVDLTAVTFLDSTGLGLLVGAAKRSRNAGGSLRVVCDNPRVLRLLRITGLDKTLPLYPDLESVVGLAQN